MTTIAKQTSFRHKLAYLAGLNYQEYEHLRHLCFKRWCEQVRESYFIDLKSLVCNDHLKNWFESQWFYWVETRVQRRYDNDLNAGVDEDDVLELIIIHFEDIENYPHTLLKMIQKKHKHLKANIYENQESNP